MTTFERAYKKIQNLSTDFDTHKKAYLSHGYTEAQVRQDFIDKFLTALGWDVAHNDQKNPFEQEVKVERNVDIGTSQRRADYAFYLAPNYRDVRLYVEAKKPFGELATKDNYFQIIRYGWNSQTPIAILTNYEQTHVIDCRYKPDIDTSLDHVISRFHFSDYGSKEKFAEIYYLISHEAVSNGSLDKFAESLPKKRGKSVQRGLFKGGYQSIDSAFLEELDEYRDILARNFKNHNPELDGEILTEITQRTIDRLVFLRFLEDKLIETKESVSNFGSKSTVWGDFVAASHRLDNIYNGIVYKKHSLLDSSSFHVDDAAFGDVCEKLCHINSPYDFNVIPIHILGSIYERFLGKVIVTTDKRARVEDKPEVRKAGGVYYTPEYIVRYIVDNTVGRLIDGKTPAKISEMRFADIACGSGSFLICIYDCLLRYHRSWYNSNPTKIKKGDCIQHEDGTFHLSLLTKREILINNIFGTDIDPQAVEVAQLSLYLKLLEEESTASAREYQLEFHETLLPSLTKNIICGNSLIGTDILDGDRYLFDQGRERRLNPMNFTDRFPGIMKDGGFDVIVGNPPYVRIQGFPRDQIDYFRDHFMSATGNYDLYVNFVERGFSLLRAGGLFGYILPNKFLRTDYGEGLRRWLSAQNAISEIIDFGASQVFHATTYTCLLFLRKIQNKVITYSKSKATAEDLLAKESVLYSPASLTSAPWMFAKDEEASIIDKISKNSLSLLNLPAYMSRGHSSGDDEIFVLEKGAEDIEPEILREPIFAKDFGRYSFTPPDKWRIIFPYFKKDGTYRLYTEQELRNKFPSAYAYLASHKTKLKKRKQYKEWYGYSAPRNLDLHDTAQIIVPLLADKGIFALIPNDKGGNLCPMASGGFTITLSEQCSMRPEYILGLLNSNLLFWKLGQTSNIFRGGWITCTKQYFGELPIKTIDFSSKEDKSRHDHIVNLVEHNIETRKHLAAAILDKDRSYYLNRCTDLDNQINNLVYELYELNDMEIRIVEGT